LLLINIFGLNGVKSKTILRTPRGMMTRSVLLAFNKQKALFNRALK
jgi:hypothetical protein